MSETKTIAGDDPVGYVPLLRRNPNYRFLWTGQVISLLGDWFNLIASASLVATLTQSGVAVGGLFVIRMMAQFLATPFAGVAADRYNRKHLLIMADLGRAVVVTGFLLVRQPSQVWLLYALTAVQMALSGLFFPARNAILPDIVSRRELGAANALSSATWSVMLAFGAALGGLAAGQWGAQPAFVIDALTFLASAALISRIVYQHDSSLISDRSVATAIRQYVEGLRYLTQHKDTLAIALHKGAFNLFVGGAFQVIQVAVAEQIFVYGEGGGTGLGLIYAFMGVGTGLGPIIARHFTGDRERPLRIAIGLSYLIAAVGLAIMAPLSSFSVFLITTIPRGAGGGIGWVFSTQLLLHKLPDRVRGRVFATEFALSTLMNAAGAGVGGWALDNTGLGISGMIWIMAGLIVVPGLLWALWNIYRDRRHPRATPEEEEFAAG
jgi:MFS family permease